MSNITISELSIGTQISIFGYKNREDFQKKNIVISYTPFYGGEKQGIKFGGCSDNGDNYMSTGYGKDPFYANLYGQQIYDQRICGLLTKENNGIYKIYDSSIKYIKPIYIHLKLTK